MEYDEFLAEYDENLVEYDEMEYDDDRIMNGEVKEALAHDNEEKSFIPTTRKVKLNTQLKTCVIQKTEPM